MWHNGRIEQITKDQSLVAKLVEEGAITEEEASYHPRRNVILYSLGSERSPKIDLFQYTLEKGDILFLCSDGLTRHVTDAEIAWTLNEESPEQATNTLIRKANERGGEDNISVAIIRFDGETAVSPQKETPAKTKPLIVTNNAPANVMVLDRSLLWMYTVALGLVQSALIFLVWLLLRV